MLSRGRGIVVRDRESDKGRARVSWSVGLSRFDNSQNVNMIVINSVPFFVFVTWKHLKQLRRPSPLFPDGVDS